MKRSIIFLILVISTVLLSFSCKSVNYSINPEWQEENFFVSAQDAADNENYDQALFYYQVYAVRYPENYRKVLAAQYETGFLYYKKGKYKQAKRVLEGVLEDYATSPYMVFFEERYKTLAEIVLKQIEDKAARPLFGLGKKKS